MKTVFARAVVALSLVSLPATALAAKSKGTHHHTVANTDAPAEKPAKHHHHKSAKTAKPAKPGSEGTAVASHHSHKDKAPVASKSVRAEPLVH
ncbi:MAG TPA: hypothetical protein VGL19_16740 [Polyangiaceae bacterium]|jgi:hypothetical protein